MPLRRQASLRKCVASRAMSSVRCRSGGSSMRTTPSASIRSGRRSPRATQSSTRGATRGDEPQVRRIGAFALAHDLEQLAAARRPAARSCRRDRRCCRASAKWRATAAICSAVAHSTLTNGRSRRELWPWTARATDSRPVPRSPSTSTLHRLGAMRRTMRQRPRGWPATRRTQDGPRALEAALSLLRGTPMIIAQEATAVNSAVSARTNGRAASLRVSHLPGELA